MSLHDKEQCNISYEVAMLEFAGLGLSITWVHFDKLNSNCTEMANDIMYLNHLVTKLDLRLKIQT